MECSAGVNRGRVVRCAVGPPASLCAAGRPVFVMFINPFAFISKTVGTYKLFEETKVEKLHTVFEVLFKSAPVSKRRSK